jgi:hypothetical protein
MTHLNAASPRPLAAVTINGIIIFVRVKTIITLVVGVVRFDLLELTAQPNGAEPTASSIGAVAMSIPAVLRTHQQLTGLIQKLVEQGVLKKEEAPGQPVINAN